MYGYISINLDDYLDGFFLNADPRTIQQILLIIKRYSFHTNCGRTNFILPGSYWMIFRSDLAIWLGFTWTGNESESEHQKFSEESR